MNDTTDQTKLDGAASRAGEAGANFTNVLGVPAFEYDGTMFVRPCERGTMLADHPSEEGLESILAEGEYHVEIRAWRKDKPPARPTTLVEVREILSTTNKQLNGPEQAQLA